MRVKNKEDIAKFLNQVVEEKQLDKVEIVEGTKLSRHIVYKLLQKGGRNENYGIKSLFKMCNFLGVKISVKL